MPSPAQVVVVGSYVQDLCWRCGEFPLAGETTVGTFRTGPGGKGSNQAIAASRAGASTLFVGAVGVDAFAREAAAFYRAEHTACVLPAKSRHATGTAAILVNTSGQNEIVVALGANAALHPRDVPATALSRARVVVCQLESNLRTTAHVLRTGRRAGAVTVLNPAPMRADFDPALLKHVDVLIPNETEFAALASLLPGFPNRGFSHQALETMGPAELQPLCRCLGVPTVIVTLGKRGCFVSEENSCELIPAHTGIKVVDTTGAGDAFVGGFAAGLVRFKNNISAAARFGNAVAALSVTRPGTAPSMPHQNEIARFLRSRPGDRDLLG